MLLELFYALLQERDPNIINPVEGIEYFNEPKFTSFRKREEILKSSFPKAQAYLLVITSENWNGFPEEDNRVGKQLFTLSSVWPTKIDLNNIDTICDSVNFFFCILPPKTIILFLISNCNWFSFWGEGHIDQLLIKEYIFNNI